MHMEQVYKLWKMETTNSSEIVPIMMIYSFFHKNNFIRTKALILEKKIKNKLRTEPGLLSHRT